MRTSSLQPGAPVHIDCDTGMDDAVALMLALAAPQIDLRSISSVSGNLSANICAANSLRILDLVNAPAIAVTAGPQKPLVRPYPRDPFSHGKDGLADLDLPASGRDLDPRFSPDAIIEAANAAGGALTLICLGPLTNLALACIKDPALPHKIASVVIIGGAFGFHSAGSTRATGDNPASEWNIYVDPEAAEIVFAAGFNLFAVGLDVATHPDVELTPAHRATLAASSKPAARFLIGVTDFVERRGFRSYCGLIDGIAVACLLDPEILEFETVSVAVETTSALSRGQTLADRRENFRWSDLPQIHAAATIDAQRYLSLLVSILA
jgi:inosine-uridine nucleoside N-ribohydrolase